MVSFITSNLGLIFYCQELILPIVLGRLVPNSVAKFFPLVLASFIAAAIVCMVELTVLEKLETSKPAALKTSLV